MLPVQIQCSSVVIRNDALDRVLDGGSASFSEIAPNAMSYADNMISQASFMSPVDAEEYAKSLEMRGLNRQTVPPDFVVVQSHERKMEPECEWLVLFEYEQRLIATMQGNESRTVIAPAGDENYDPDIVKHYSAEEVAEQFEFVERKGGIDTYRHKETGQLVYHTRKTETADEVYNDAIEIVWQYRRNPGSPVSSKQNEDLSQAIGNLQSLAAKHPDTANVALALGVAWFAVGKVDAARRQLDRAAELDAENTIILKELGGACLEQSDFDAAVVVAMRAVAVVPDDTDLLGNLAVSQLLSQKISESRQTVTHALSIDSSDSINQNIKRIVEAVASGQRPQPTSLAEMMKPAKRKASFLSRIFGSS